MFKEIEKEYIKRSICHKSDKFIMLTSIIYCVIFMLLYYDKNIFLKVLLIVVLFLLVFFTLYLYIFIVNKKYDEEKKYKFYQIKKVMIEYKKNEYIEDTINLGIILEGNGVKNNEQLLEIIRHYQSIMPKDINRGTELIAFISLIISFCALIVNDFIFEHVEYVSVIGSILFIMLLLYLCCNYIFKSLNAVFGKKDLYRKLETVLVDIYVKNLLKEKQ